MILNRLQSLNLPKWDEMSTLTLLAYASIALGLYVLLASAALPVLFWGLHKFLRLAVFAAWLVPPMIALLWLVNQGLKVDWATQTRVVGGVMGFLALVWVDLKLELLLGQPAHLFLPDALVLLVEGVFWAILTGLLVALAVGPGLAVLWGEKRLADQNAPPEPKGTHVT